MSSAHLPVTASRIAAAASTGGCDPGIGTADDWPWPSQDRETSPWRRPGDPLVLVKRSQGHRKPVRPAKPLKPRRDLEVIPFPAIAAGGADQLIHAGVTALDAAVHDAGRLVPQGRLTAVAGLTGGRGCHDPLSRDTPRSVRGAGTAHVTHPPGAGSRSCHYQGLEQRRCYSQTVTRRSRKRHSQPGRIMPDHKKEVEPPPESCPEEVGGQQD